MVRWTSADRDAVEDSRAYLRDIEMANRRDAERHAPPEDDPRRCGVCGRLQRHAPGCINTGDGP